MRLTIVLAALLTGSVAATAATLDLSGPYGNEAGCAAVGGAYPHSEDKLVLNKDSVEGYESYCEFVAVLMSKTGGAVVNLLCGGEGETWLNRIVVSPSDPENGNRRQIFQSSGDLWAEVAPCE